MNTKQKEQFDKLKSEFDRLEQLWANLLELQSENRKAERQLVSEIIMQKTKVGSLISILQSVL